MLLTALSCTAKAAAFTENLDKLRPPDTDVREALLNIIFQGDPLREQIIGKEFVIVLRFTRSTHTFDSQLVITKFDDGQIVIEKYLLQRSLAYYIHFNLPPNQAGNYSLEELRNAARKIPVAYQMVNVSVSDLRQILDQFQSLRLSPMLDTGLFVDGTRYELWFLTPSQSVYYMLNGGEVGSKSRFSNPLIGWMNYVYENAN